MSRWIGFLAVFLSVYGALHLYMLIKLRRTLYLDGLGYVLVCVVLAFLMISPILARILSSQGYMTSCLVLTWIGYLWMGYLFLFICLAVPLDLYHLIMAGLQQVFDTDWTGFMLLRRHNLMLTSSAAALLMLYGALSAYRVGTEQVTLRSPKIPAHAGRVRIVQISDVHLGAMFYPGRIGPIEEAIRKAQPDILVSTGDLIDGGVDAISGEAQVLKSIPAPLGKFAVTGNHEYYHGIEDSLSTTEKAGFHLLRNSATVVQDLIVIAGVDDPAGGRDTAGAEAAALANQPTGKFTILLKHRPEIDSGGQNRFDLQLSGHTHKGQIFPFGLFVRLFYPMIDGLYEPAPARFLYASRGTGTWGPPVRVLAPPEITIFDLLPQETGPTPQQ